MPVIGYNLNIPAANNNPSQDQPKMQTNTNAINTLLSLDHYTFADNAAGRHKQVSLANEAAPGIPANTNGVLYANLDTGQSWPFWQNALGSFNLLGPLSAVNNGYTWMGGVLVQWGQVTSTNSSFTLQAFNIPFPNACFVVMTQIYGSGTPPGGSGDIEIRKSTVSVASFQWCMVTNSGEYTGFYWVAIGN